MGRLWGTASSIRGRVFDPNAFFICAYKLLPLEGAAEDMVIEHSEKHNFNVAANKDVANMD